MIDYDSRHMEDELDWRENQNLKGGLLENTIENSVTSVSFVLGCVVFMIVLVFLAF